MDREVQYKMINDGKFDIEIECPYCHNIIKGYKEAIDSTKDDWMDGYMHFVCKNCNNVLKVK